MMRNRYTKIVDMLEILRWLNVDSTTNLCLMIFIYMFDKNMLPDYFTNKQGRRQGWARVGTCHPKIGCAHRQKFDFLI